MGLIIETICILEEEMKKKPLIITVSAIVIIVIISLAVTLLMTDKELVLPELEADDISNISYIMLDKDETTNLDIEEFLTYYNQIYDIRNNELGEGTTADRSIVIELKDGSKISICNSGSQFEVSFCDSDGESQQYWGKQQGIYNMLLHGFYSLN